MTDVTAVVLTLGESYTERALASLARQTVRPADILMVTDEVRPFHRAINSAAERVTTPYFIQVDADMILDPVCFEEMRAAVSEHAGIVMGQLHDPLLGEILGVRLFRRDCFRDLRVPDEIAPMHGFETALQQSGWSILGALRRANGCVPASHAFGEHRPDYDPPYTFKKFTLSGARNRYRQSSDQLRNVFARLRRSSHPASMLAQIAAAHGIFRRERNDQLGRIGGSEELDGLNQFLESTGVGAGAAESVAQAIRSDDLQSAFGIAVAAAVELRERRAGATFRSCMGYLANDGRETAWVATVGLCHGLFVERPVDARLAEEFDWLKPLLRFP